ncbi:MAG: phosphopantetheine-binding protein [Gallionella sp.]
MPSPPQSMPQDNDMPTTEIPNTEINDLALIQNFLKDRVESPLLDKIVPAATLTELGIDSLMLVELIFEFEDRTGITVPADLPPPKTVGELLQQLKDFRNQPTALPQTAK